MEKSELLAKEIDRALEGKRLLTHPFYQRWQNGELKDGELKEYSEQYRHFEALLPGYLSEILDQLPEGEAADYIQSNYDDESGKRGVSHLELFGSFLAASGGSSEAVATPATAALVEVYRQVGSENVGCAIAGLIAYETQAEKIAETKSDGLRDHYGYDEVGTRFWDLHATLEGDHAEWATEALAASGATPEDAFHGASVIAQAWWNFLDEREVAAHLSRSE